MYFVADDGVHGAELWQSDGTADGTVLVAEIRPGAEDGDVSNLIDVDGTLFFAADDGVNGRGLWVLKPEQPLLPGDANGDGQVDFPDFVILANSFGKEGPFTFADGDFDEDGRVDFSDFVILANNFGRQRDSTPAATTPAQPSDLAIDLAFAKAEESLIDDTLLVLSAA